MQRQYKIFKISKNKVDFTLKKLNEKRNFIRITESVLAVEYDYTRSYWMICLSSQQCNI